MLQNILGTVIRSSAIECPNGSTVLLWAKTLGAKTPSTFMLYRRAMLTIVWWYADVSSRGLHQEKLIRQPTLDAFRDAGFLFDHSIRCPLSSEEVKTERRAAILYRSVRAKNFAHLVPLLSRASTVWVMGYIARNAIANATIEFPKENHKISKSPYPGMVENASRFFLSAYFSRWNQRDVPRICAAFSQFAKTNKIFENTFSCES